MASIAQASLPTENALLPAGPQAAHIHALWLLMLGVCTVAFVAVLIALALALARAPKAAADTPPDVSGLAHDEPRVRRSVIFAVTITIALLIVLLAGSVFTDRALAGLALNDALHIELTGHQWWWQAQYDDADPSRRFETANELHVPVGRPVIITLEADDVIHSFWVPNLHGKKDLIPGRTATITFRADEPGTYRGQCAEFCGYQHANMALFVIVQPRDDYDHWADAQRKPASAPQPDLPTRGQQVFVTGTCVMCHAITGTTASAHKGPDLTHLASRATIAAGALPNNDASRAAWISDPQRIKPGVNMPATTLSPSDLQALLAYLETLQ